MTPPSAKTIVAFGHFDLQGGRSWAIRTGLEAHGHRIILCRTEAKGMGRKWKDLRRQWESIDENIDAVYVPFLGHFVLPLARKLASERNVPVIFDAFLSLYDTEVHDRKRYSVFHPYAWFLWLSDWLCCKLSTLVLLDTEEHKQYFVEKYGIPADKILALPIGCRTDLFQPSDVALSASKGTDFIVEFHGTFIPLQGIETILRAAAILQEQSSDIRFHFLGKGQTYKQMTTLAADLQLRNVDFKGAVPMEDLPRHIAAADIALGIFGTTAKADRVIPNKAYEVLQCAKPLITGDTAAARRVFKNGIDVVLVKPGDANDLAEKILLLKNDPELRKRIAENGCKLSLEKFQPKEITEPLHRWLQSHLEPLSPEGKA